MAIEIPAKIVHAYVVKTIFIVHIITKSRNKKISRMLSTLLPRVCFLIYAANEERNTNILSLQLLYETQSHLNIVTSISGCVSPQHAVIVTLAFTRGTGVQRRLGQESATWLLDLDVRDKNRG